MSLKTLLDSLRLFSFLLKRSLEATLLRRQQGTCGAPESGFFHRWPGCCGAALRNVGDVDALAHKVEDLKTFHLKLRKNNEKRRHLR